MDSSDEELLAYLEEADSDADSEEEEEIRKLHAKREARVQDALRRKLAGLPVEPASAAVDDSDDDFGLSSDDDEVGRRCHPMYSLERQSVRAAWPGPWPLRHQQGHARVADVPSGCVHRLRRTRGSTRASQVVAEE
jgi:hypothetical protein